MKIEQVVSPNQPSIHGAKANPQLDARERAIQKFMQPTTAAQAAAQDHPVPNPTQVSPEELGAVKAPERGNSLNNEEVVNTAPTQEAPKAAEEPLSSQYAILARKEKAIRQREQQLRAREAELRAQSKPAESTPSQPSLDMSKYVSVDDLLRDPFGILNEKGLGYDKLTEIAMQGPSHETRTLTNEVKALRDELAKIKGETENTKKSFEEQQVMQRDQAIRSIRNEVSNAVRNDPSFEAIKTTGSEREVVNLIVRTFDEDGILLSAEEAAREVEEYLVNEAIRLTKLNKIQQKLAPKVAPAPQVQKAAESNQKPQMKTLTNSVNSSAKMSARERAILAFQGKLSK
jgi:hypothetical protein